MKEVKAVSAVIRNSKPEKNTHSPLLLSQKQTEFLNDLKCRIIKLAGEETAETKSLLKEVAESLVRTGDIPDMGIICVSHHYTGRPGYIFFDSHLDSDMTHEEKMILVHVLPPLSESRQSDSNRFPVPAEDSVPVNIPIHRNNIQLPAEILETTYRLSPPAGMMALHAWNYICSFAVSQNLKDEAFLPLIKKITGTLSRLDACMEKKYSAGRMTVPPSAPPHPAAPINYQGLKMLMEKFITALHNRSKWLDCVSENTELIKINGEIYEDSF